MQCHKIYLVLMIGMLWVSWAMAQDAPVQITLGEHHDCDPSVSPDGKYLAFSSDRTGSFNIYLLTFGESGVRQLTQSKKDDRFPCWSRDGKTIVFSSKRTGNGDLYEMAADGGSGYLQLTDREQMDEFASYHPNGTGLLYTTAPKKLVPVRVKQEVVYAEEKGRANNVRALAEGEEPRFSPDAKQIVFVSKRTKNKDIWRMNADGGLQTQLTTDPKDDENPCFSPDGTQIAFVSNRAGSADIWVMNVDGSNPRQLTSAPGDEAQPCWSAGEYIYYTQSSSSSQSNIYRIKAP